MQDPGPEAIHCNTSGKNHSRQFASDFNNQQNINSLLHRSFHVQVLSKDFVKIPAICWWGKFQLLCQSWFGTNFRSVGGVLVLVITNYRTTYFGLLSSYPSSIFQTDAVVLVLCNNQLCHFLTKRCRISNKFSSRLAGVESVVER